jgi:amidase
MPPVLIKVLLFLAALAGIPVQPTTPDDSRVVEATVASVHASFARRDLTCVGLVEAYLARIDAYDQETQGELSINAVKAINPKALETARELDRRYRRSGPVGPLHCVPVLVKDQVETVDMPTTYGSAIFEGFQSGRDATIVTKMKQAGAVILAKVNLGEYASRYVGSAFGVIRNPYDLTRNPSGSSGGTGAGIAANFGLLGIGEDTGGSIRGPAAVASLVGLRPTTPLISRYGMMPATPTRDTLGPMTRTVRDAALLTNVIAGYDPNDPLTAYSVGNVPTDYTAGLSPRGLRGKKIGIIREPFSSSTEPGTDDYNKVKSVVDKAVADLDRLGAEVIDPFVIPDLRALLSAASGGSETEEAVDAYLAQLPHAPVKTFREIALSPLVTPTRREGLMDALDRSTADPDWLEAQAGRERLRLAVLDAMARAGVDAVMYATFDHQPTVIPPDVLTNPEPQDDYGKGGNRGLSPPLGFPALTLPAGFTVDRLPVGIELLGRPFSEKLLFELGYAYEQGTRHRQPPPITPPLRQR